MSKYATMAVLLLLAPCEPARAQDRDTLVDSQAVLVMPMMWMHLDSLGTWSPTRMHQMMPAHQQMAAQMMQTMGRGDMMGHGMMGTGSYWVALRDSVQADLSALPGLSGKDLAARMQAHVDRMRRLMVMGMGMMGAGGWAAMPGGCGMLDSLGHMSPQHAQLMWSMHARMSGQMMDAMIANMRAGGVAPSVQWLALRDSVRADMARLPYITRDSLRSGTLAHAGRMHRLMGMQVQGMGMHMGSMGMGCSW
jgi:hypothetical protein